MLRRKGIQAKDAFSLAYPDAIVPSVEREIRNSDFMVAILSSKHSSSNVYYEIGFARGLRKPIF